MQQQLVEQARGGDRDAFASLAAASIGKLFNIAQLMVGDHDLAEDVVQETLVLAWRDLKGLRDPGGFDAWLHRILVRSVYREARRERRRSSRAIHIPELRWPSDAARDIENRDALERGFRRLAPDHRAVLVLRHYLGFSDEEAAGALSVPVGTVKSRLNRAASALRSELEADARGGERLAVETIP